MVSFMSCIFYHIENKRRQKAWEVSTNCGDRPASLCQNSPHSLGCSGLLVPIHRSLLLGCWPRILAVSDLCSVLGVQLSKHCLFSSFSSRLLPLRTCLSTEKSIVRHGTYLTRGLASQCLHSGFSCHIYTWVSGSVEVVGGSLRCLGDC